MSTPLGRRPDVHGEGRRSTVHITAIFAYAVLCGLDLPIGDSVGIMVNLVLNFTGRAAMLSLGWGGAGRGAAAQISIVLSLFPSLLAGVFFAVGAGYHVAPPAPTIGNLR